MLTRRPTYFILLLTLCLALLPACRRNADQGDLAPGTTPPITPPPVLSPTTSPPTQTAQVALPAAILALPDNLQLDNYPLNRPLVIQFSQPMDAASGGDEPLIVRPRRIGSFSWNDSQTELTFTPDSDFEPRRRYTITLNEALRSAAQQPLDQTYAWELHIAARPQVLSYQRHETIGSAQQPVFFIRFNQPMDTDCLPQATISSAEGPAATATLHWQDNELIVTTETMLRLGTAYTFTLNASCTDQLGVPLSRSYTWHYTPPPLIAAATLTEPGFSTSAIQFDLSYAVDAASFAAAFQLQPDLAGSFTWNNDFTQATFQPDGLLRTNTVYTVTFTHPVQDNAGATFTHVPPFTFTTPAPITQATPRGNNVHPISLLTITFNQAVDTDSVAAALTITPPLEGSLSWQENTLTFTPQNNLFAAQTSYTVTVNSSIRNAAGQPILDAPYAWHFRTGELTRVGSFGYGPRLQLIHASGRRALQYTAVSARSVPLDFALYEVDETWLRQNLELLQSVQDPEEVTCPDIGNAPLAVSWRSETTFAAQEYNNTQELLLPAEVAPGIYQLQMNAGFLNDCLTVLITDYTILTKADADARLFWVTEINGSVVPGSTLTFYDANGQIMAQGQTDANGLYRLPLAQSTPQLVIARAGAQITINGEGGIWTAGSYGWWGGAGEVTAGPAYVAYLYTDRPIYRPGQIVNFKGIVRQDDDAVLSMPPAGTPVTITVRDARNNLVRTLNLNSNDFGTVNGQFPIAEGATLGSYQLEIIVGQDASKREFKVQDYRKPDYDVTVTTPQTRYVSGDIVPVTIGAHTFFGEPISGGTVSILNYYASPTSYWDESYGSVSWRLPYDGPTDTTASLDASGMASYELDTNRLSNYGEHVDWRSSLRRTTWAIEGTVNDGSHQTASGQAIIEVYSAAVNPQLDTNGFTHPLDQPLTVNVSVQDIWDQPLPNHPVTVSLRRWNSSSYDYSTVLQTRELTTDADGAASATIDLTNAGYYQVRVVSADAAGRSVEVTDWVFVYSDEISVWWGQEHDLQLRVEQESYAPGENATLLIESSFAGPALLTFERGTLRRQELITLTPPVTWLETSILPEDVPNIWITVNAWQPVDNSVRENMWQSEGESRLLTSSVNVQVPATTKTLNVTITPDQTTYAPRQQATFTVRVTNYRNEPVSAELSLAVVDEAIFALSSDLSGRIYDGFYFERRNLVQTYHSLAPSRSLWGGFGGGGGGGDMPGSPRRDFPDTAAWFPSLRTDANGEVVVTLTLPDNLTSWRLTAKAATADTQVGESVANITVTQPVIVRPILPRTLTAGDNAHISAIVHNLTDQPQTLSLFIHTHSALTGGAERPSPLPIMGDVTQTVTLQAGELRLVGWPVQADKAGEAIITVWARYADGAEADAVQLPLTINPLSVPDVTTQIGDFTGAWETVVEMPAAALPEISHVTIELSRSIAGSILSGLDYLTGFPYGCVEQTMSKALPNAVVARAFAQLGRSDLLANSDLDNKIDASVQRLYGFQHDDGGWGWWYNDDSEDYQTAWVLLGLNVIADAGYPIDPTVLQRGADYLLPRLPEMDPRTRAFALYSLSLANQASAAAARDLLTQEAELDAFSRAALALTLYELGEAATAQQLVDDLLSQATRLEDGRIFWDEGRLDGYYHQKVMASTTRSTALVLSALAQIRPGSNAEPDVVRWLMSQRRLDGWGTTNETAFTILGLTDHLLGVAPREDEGIVSVELNGRSYMNGALDRNNPVTSLALPASDMLPGANSLRLTYSGSAPLYYTVSSRIYLAQADIAAAGDVLIERTYRDPDTNQVLQRVTAGQLVRVDVRVTMPDRTLYAIVEDNLPGGLEAVNEGLENSSYQAEATLEDESSRYAWRKRGYNHKEIRGSRVTFFITESPKGTHTFSYFARATHAGSFVAMPAYAEAMYNPAIWGRSASTQLEILP